MNEMLPSVNPGPMLLDASEAAAALRMSDRTLRKLTEPNGKLKCVRFPNRVMYRPEDVSAWLDELQANPLPPKVVKPIVRSEKRGRRRTTSARKSK